MLSLTCGCLFEHKVRPAVARVFGRTVRVVASLMLIGGVCIGGLSRSGGRHGGAIVGGRVVGAVHRLGGERRKEANGAGNTASSGDRASTIPKPIDVLGFTPGDDRKLASWSQIASYFVRLAHSSDRVKLEDLGKTTLGRPFLLATISSPANLARLARYREIQQKLADPRTINSDDSIADKLIAEGRAIVLITCGIHSVEVGGNLVSMNIAYKLASDNSAATREILDNCIILLVPSLNPDGVDIVKQWYDKTLGTPSEGTGPPELFHHYTGHDNNRDWYAFTQVETQMTVDKVHNVWHPQIVHDIHQQEQTGSRFFLPPYVDPWEPNVPPRIQAGVNFMGSDIAWELTGEGKAGVVINGVYDAWTPARAYQHYHGGIRILSETASARLASPVTVPFDKLTPQVNLDPKVRSWNFPLVWKGGEWRLSNIVDYMQSGAFALMRNAARYRELWLRDFYEIGKDAVRARHAGEVFAFLLPPPTFEASAPGGTATAESAVGQPASEASLAWRKYGFERMESILERGGVEVLEAEEPFEASGRQYPSGTAIVAMAQPYGCFAKTLLERQYYPDLREYPGGPPRRPYDVTAQTLGLLMGSGTVMIDQPFSFPPTKRLVLPETPPVLAAGSGIDSGIGRLGIYKNYQPSMDEGWTRWMFDQLKIKYSPVVDSDLRMGNLVSRYDCIIIPDQTATQIAEGLPVSRYPANVAGGMGSAGIEALKEFVQQGGTLVALNRASRFAIQYLGAPVRDVLSGVPSKEFYCPGSILKVDFESDAALAHGVPRLDGSRSGDAAAWFEGGPALDPASDQARVIARFSDSHDLLLSGWLLGAEKMAGHGAIV
ncbi:MAG TPA: M14 metallopeptidase family protein, partial [Blastocatellia bacterium]|nr:M14 metallopeptidase family protein [Blastocatellia bacterium]